MKEVPSHGYVRITGPAAGRPADRLFPDHPETIPPVPYWKSYRWSVFQKGIGIRRRLGGAMLLKMAGFPQAKRVSGT